MANEYYKNKASVEEYIRLAKDVNGNELIEKLKKVLPAKSAVLELGSGPGSDWKILNKTYHTTGSDNSNEFLSHLKTENPEGEFLLLDAVSINTDQNYDGIYSNKVLHHLQTEDLIQSVKRQWELLNEGGIICHSFWKGVGSEIFKGLLVNYHLESDLRTFFKEGFEILSIDPYEEFEANDSLLLIAKKTS